MKKVYEIRELANDLMEEATSLVDDSVRSMFGSLEDIAGLSPEYLEMIQKMNNLMEKSKKFVRLTMESYSELSDLVEANNRLLQDIKKALSEKS